MIRSNSITKSLKAGLWFIPIGLGVGLYLTDFKATSVTLANNFFIYSTMAIYLTSIFFWWIFIERKNKHSLIRYLLVGAWNGFASHHLCWFLMMIVANITNIVGHLNPLEAFKAAFMLSFFSWVLFGLLTTTLGLLVSYLLWRKRNKQSIRTV